MLEKWKQLKSHGTELECKGMGKEPSWCPRPALGCPGWKQEEIFALSSLTSLQSIFIGYHVLQPRASGMSSDWANWEYIEVITSSIKKNTDFLNSFDMSCRSRLATLNEKLTALERRIEYIEALVTKGETLTWNSKCCCWEAALRNTGPRHLIFCTLNMAPLTQSEAKR
ncbi:hypothetical protein GH733_018543 [Mirounga leonina]|nr:hypothetical protein GH733_018543 [Mirounga leonina]